MNKTFAVSLFAIAIFSCNRSPAPPEAKPYKFNRDMLDQMVKDSTAIYNVFKRPDGTLKREYFYLGDTAKFQIDYDTKSNISEVFRFDSHGQAIWQETFYPNGQRKAHYSLKAFAEKGPISVYNGAFEEYYDNGNVKSIGSYDRNQLKWRLEYDKLGQAGDTMVYEYEEQKPDTPVADPKSGSENPRVEKIKTATTPD